MSTITGSCGTSQAQLLIERGFADAQARHVQQAQDLQQASQQSPGAIASVGSGEPNKGINIDLYA